MYFLMAFWYVMSAIGLASIAVFFLLLVNIFDEEVINRGIGYKNYFVIMGAYTLIVVPSAATINGGSGENLLFFLGCICPGFCLFIDKLLREYQSSQTHILTTQIPAVEPAPFLPVTPAPEQSSYVPAPSSLANDFDVPPQR